MTLITKQQLLERTRVSESLSDKQVVPYIQDAETFDLPTLLSGNLIADINAFNITASEWANETPYLTGGYTISGNVYYKALQDSTGITPGTDTAIWEADYKATLRYNHLPDFLIWSAYRRMLLEHGRNIVGAGITTPTDPQATYQPATDKARGEMVASAESKANHYRGIIDRYLVEHNLVTRTECEPYRRRNNGRVTAI